MNMAGRITIQMETNLLIRHTLVRVVRGIFLKKSAITNKFARFNLADAARTRRTTGTRSDSWRRHMSAWRFVRRRSCSKRRSHVFSIQNDSHITIVVRAKFNRLAYVTGNVLATFMARLHLVRKGLQSAANVIIEVTTISRRGPEKQEEEKKMEEETTLNESVSLEGLLSLKARCAMPKE